MTRTIVTALAFSFALGTAAIAQTGSATNPNPTGSAMQDQQGAFPKSWEGPIGDAFYSDTSAFTLRSQDEIAANWAALTAEQQAQVRSDCQTITTTQSDSGTDNMATSSTTTTAEGGSNFATAPSTTELCGWVGSQ
jgi:hypothetical protein